jgi:acetyltransferase-like isoleucine patch superfamily enzyme
MGGLLSPQVEGAESCVMGDGVVIGRNSRVTGNRVWIGAGTVIGDGVVIKSGVVNIGRKCRIEDDVLASWHGENSQLFSMGDCGFLGQDSRVLVREFHAGDYVVLHNHLLANGDGDLRIGNNAWMGQNGILNANRTLRIGNNVGIGAYSAIWTHGKFGALIDGCLMHKEAPVSIDDDACLWRAVVSPGVTVGKRATVLPGSILTKDAPPGSCFGGVPAADISDKVQTYREVAIEEQFEMTKGFASEFLQKEYPGMYSQRGESDYRVGSGLEERFRLLLKWEVEDKDIAEEDRAIVVGVKDRTTAARPGVSLFDLANRTYTKWLTEPEVKFMWFMNDSRARFNPL